MLVFRDFALNSSTGDIESIGYCNADSKPSLYLHNHSNATHGDLHLHPHAGLLAPHTNVSGHTERHWYVCYS